MNRIASECGSDGIHSPNLATKRGNGRVGKSCLTLTGLQLRSPGRFEMPGIRMPVSEPYTPCNLDRPLFSQALHF